MLTQNDLDQIRSIVKDEVKTEVKGVNGKINGVNKELKKINGKLDITIKFFDTSWINHEKRLDRIDATLHLPKFDPLQ